MISLDEDAKFLLGEGHEEPNMRSDMRFCDNANVLSSLKLLEKEDCISAVGGGGREIYARRQNCMRSRLTSVRVMASLVATLVTITVVAVAAARSRPEGGGADASLASVGGGRVRGA